MKIRLQVTPNEGDPYEVETNLFVVVAWERKFKRQASSLGNGIGAEDLAYFAYESSKVAGVMVPLAFDDFIKKTKAIEVISEESASFTEAAVSDAH
jgi:hypothetical protein